MKSLSILKFSLLFDLHFLKNRIKRFLFSVLTFLFLQKHLPIRVITSQFQYFSYNFHVLTSLNIFSLSQRSLSWNCPLFKDVPLPTHRKIEILIIKPLQLIMIWMQWRLIKHIAIPKLSHRSVLEIRIWPLSELHNRMTP